MVIAEGQGGMLTHLPPMHHSYSNCLMPDFPSTLHVTAFKKKVIVLILTRFCVLVFRGLEMFVVRRGWRKGIHCVASGTVCAQHLYSKGCHFDAVPK